MTTTNESSAEEKLAVVIDRRTWLRGAGGWSCIPGGVDSKCRVSDGRQCCLGFIAKALGATDTDILGVGFPSNVDPTRWVCPAWLKHDEIAAAKINDDREITDGVREARLHELFAPTPVRLEFVG